ncbi:MAG: 5'/3'-nucleotidase SurE [Bacteroidaceae bacterium]|nr:5'/3'-nucleotidase SurE [Bacteroidaceae bacterium]
MPNRPLILITNDDGVQAQGIQVLTSLMRQLGDVVVVAPDSARSGSACAITPTGPVRVTLLNETEGMRCYACSGTPVDCVKLALEKVVPRKPDLMVSGINHGDNASVSLHYSGTVGAVLEACMKSVPAIAYSLMTRQKQCDFSPYEEVVLRVARCVLADGLPQDVCLNVNFPLVERLQGVRVCRLARGNWLQEWGETDKPDVYQLTGYFTNLEPEAEDTDYWALQHGMASVTPLQLDMTHYPLLRQLAKDLSDDTTQQTL